MKLYQIKYHFFKDTITKHVFEKDSLKAIVKGYPLGDEEPRRIDSELLCKKEDIINEKDN